MNATAERLVALFVTPPGGPVSVPAGRRGVADVAGPLPVDSSRRPQPAGLAASVTAPGADAPAGPLADAPAGPPADAPAGPPAGSASVTAPGAGSADAPEVGGFGLRVCVLGGERAGAALAWALAARMARLPPARCAALCAVPPGPDTGTARPPGPSGTTTPTARRVARCLESTGHRASARGRVVCASLPEAPGDARALFAAVDAQAPGAPTVMLLGGARRPGFDALVAAQDLVLVVVAADAPPSLSALAVAELAVLAPGALVQVVPLAARHGLAARRAAVGRALEALR